VICSHLTIHKLTGQKATGHSAVATYLLAVIILLAVASASGQQVHQLLYDNSNWSDQDLNGTRSTNSLTAFQTTPNDQSHVYYLTYTPSHIHQLFFNGTSWSDEDLTTLSGGPTAFGAVTGFSVGNFQYVYYVSQAAPQHVHQLLYNNSTWVDSDLSAISGGKANAIGSYGLVAFTTTPALHVYYQDNNNADIHQLFSANGATWEDQDLTQLTGAPEPFVLWSGFNIGNLQYLYYQDFNHDLHQLIYNNSNWADTDLTVSTKTPRPSVFPETAFVIPGTKKMRIYYFNQANNHLLQLASSNGKTWTSTDITKKAKAPLPDFASFICAYVTTPNEGLHVFYEAGYHINQIYQPTTTTWANQDLTSLTNAGPAVGYSTLSGFSSQNFQYLFYVAQ
jgi:hypothetical protein